MLPAIGVGLVGLGKALIDGITGHFKRSQEIKQAAAENRIRLLRDEATNNHEWEMKQLENAGWKDDILFYAIVGMYVYSAISPEGARSVFESWKNLPDWWVEITAWMVAAVLGVKKIGDYLPSVVQGVRSAFGNSGQGISGLLKEDKE